MSAIGVGLKIYSTVFALSVMFCLTIPALAVVTPTPPAIAVDSDGVIIHGKQTFLLIGTFQPSRVDPSDWDRWLGMFAESGFNTIDCLVPWNFHEPIEGQFDFSSPTHDLPRFLRLCEKHHLYVFLRSGPYVCDEWNGGGLPAWLVPKQGLEVRRSNPLYLSFVRAWMRALDRVVKPYLITGGGPIIFDQLENELDYYGCPDPKTYVGALRDYARQDGIDVPLTACVGSPGGDERPLYRAMGMADGVLPTGNFYVSGNVEARARSFIDALHRVQYTGGVSMAGLPVICSETGRDENRLRRLLASGLKGIAPFNFVGGSNSLFNNGDTNWANPLALISTSTDYGGMISYSGTKTANWWAARRLAGFVNTFSDALCRARSDTNWEGGFLVSNGNLGANEGSDKPRRIYRLSAPHGPQFIFLWNDQDAAQNTTITVDGMTLPRHSQLTVPPHYDQIVPVNFSLAPWGLPGVTLRYTTSEIYGCVHKGNETRLTLTGNRGDNGEISLYPFPDLVKGQASINKDVGNQGCNLNYNIGEYDTPISCKYGKRILTIYVVPRQSVKTIPSAKPIVQDLRTGMWQSSDVATPTALARPFAVLPTMESACILQGAAWYRVAFESHSTGASPTLSGAHAGDVVTAYLNGKCLGTQIGVGSELHFDTDGALQDGRNELAIRVEVWGHSNFDDGRVPSLHLNSPRGIWGTVTLGDKPLVPLRDWQVSAEEPSPPDIVSDGSAALDMGRPGHRGWHERLFTKMRGKPLALATGMESASPFRRRQIPPVLLVSRE